MNYPKYLRIKEVAAILDIDPRTVTRKANLGEIPGHFKLGSMHFIDEELFRASLKKKATDKTVSTITQKGHAKDKHNLLK